MDTNSPTGAGPNRSDPARLAIVAACGIFTISFGTMIFIGVSATRIPDSAVILDTCEWLVALTATAIVGLITRSRQ
jgi:hypothetical protein